MEFAQSAPIAIERAGELRDPSLVLILSDINMPGMSGLEMLPQVRAKRPDVPVIMITAYGDAETKKKAIERGAEGLLTKPIDFSLLRQEIDTRLGQAAITITVLFVVVTSPIWRPSSSRNFAGRSAKAR